MQIAARIEETIILANQNGFANAKALTSHFQRQKPSIGVLCLLCTWTDGGQSSTEKSGAASNLHESN